MFAVVAQAPNLLWVLVVPIVGVLCCIAIGSILFSTLSRPRRR